jgi:hypothetical protein
VPNILQLMVRRGSHATAHYSMENRHDILWLDVLRWGENGPSDPKRLHHHANPVASIKHTKHEWDESSHTMRYVRICSAQSVAICVMDTFLLLQEKEIDTRDIGCFRSLRRKRKIEFFYSRKNSPRCSPGGGVTVVPCVTWLELLSVPRCIVSVWCTTIRMYLYCLWPVAMFWQKIDRPWWSVNEWSNRKWVTLCASACLSAEILWTKT